MTERLYHDSQELEFDARVIGHDGSPNRVILDRTTFYPTSGGQQHDTGSLGDQRVVDVIDDDQRIIHVLAGPLRADQVHGVVYADRRLDHSIQHTGQHLISAIAEDRFGWPTVSVHFGAEHSLIELEVEQIGRSDLQRLQLQVNDAVALALPVTWAFEPAGAALGLRKPTSRTGMIRVVAIAGVDRNACGGTHVSSTARLGSIWLAGTERIRRRVRLSYRAGPRVLRHLAELDELIGDAARSAECAPAELVEMIVRRRDEMKLVTAHIHELEAALAGIEAESLLNASIELRGDRRLVLDFPSARSTHALESLGRAVAAHPGAIFVAATLEGATLMLAAHPGTAIDCGAILKSVLTVGGGRGGGTAAFARGRIGPDTELGAVVAAIRRAVDRAD